MSENLHILKLGTTGAILSEVAPSAIDIITRDPSQLSQIVTQLVILVVTIFKLFKKTKQ